MVRRLTREPYWSVSCATDRDPRAPTLRASQPSITLLINGHRLLISPSPKKTSQFPPSPSPNLPLYNNPPSYPHSPSPPAANFPHFLENQTPHFPSLFFDFLHGSYKADRSQVHRRQGAEEAAGNKGCQEVRSGDRRSEEAAPIPSRNGGAERNQEVPEEHGASDP